MLSLDLESAPEQHDLVQRSKSALVELQTLYEEVRNYAAPIQLERSRCNLQRLCSEVWGNLIDHWRTNHVQLNMNCEPCPDVRCDKHRIGQVFRNLFENSLSVAPANSRIRVDCRVIAGEENKGQRVEVTVSDEGPGFEPSQRSKIFEPFYTTKTKGTGLGMAICKRIIDAHDGKIFVADGPVPLRQPGSNSHQRKEHLGATIVFELPVE